MTYYEAKPDGTIKPSRIPEPKLENLYQEVILDHNRNPRNYKELTNPTVYSHGVNPLCGDDYHLYLEVGAGGIIKDIGFQGNGCAISKSSASLLTSLVKGKSLDEALKLEKNVLQLLTQDQVPATVREGSGRMTILEGVKEFPVRVKCATLIWHTLGDALKDAGIK
jgi:nitrogen fixation protein NifU and related proteins